MLLQDEHRGLSKALANTPHAKTHAAEAAQKIVTQHCDQWLLLHEAMDQREDYELNRGGRYS